MQCASLPACGPAAKLALYFCTVGVCVNAACEKTDLTVDRNPLREHAPEARGQAPAVEFQPAKMASSSGGVTAASLGVDKTALPIYERNEILRGQVPPTTDCSAGVQCRSARTASSRE